MNRLLALLALLLLTSLAPGSAPERTRLATIGRQNDVVVIVADARTGRRLAAIRPGAATADHYRPGSIFKLAIALAALRSGTASRFAFECTGEARIGASTWQCWNPVGHGKLELDGAIANSCNLYFRQLASRLPSDAITTAARDLGMIDDGTPPFAISDSTLLGEAFDITPAGMLRTALALASRGRLAPRRLDLTSGRYRPLFRGMRDCVSSGTARDAWSRRFAFAGKTGTSFASGSSGARIGWFLGFAPASRPRVAIVVLHRRGIGADAARVARQVLAEVL